MSGLRILHVINDLRIGGTEHLLVKHVRTLKENHAGITSEVCVLGSRQHAYPDYAATLPEATYLGFSGRYRNLLESFGIVLKLRRLIRRLSPDIMHSYLWTADVLVALASIGFLVRHVAHIVDRRGDRRAGSWRARWKAKLTRSLYRLANTRFVAVSDACRDHAIELYAIAPARIVVAHNGIPVQEFACERASKTVDTAGSPLVFGTISDIRQEKGHRYLVEALKQLGSDINRMRLRIAGDGRLRADIEALVRSAGVSAHVEFLGQVSSAAAFYRGIDVFVIPSIYAEGLPTTILEAMASGLSIIATDVGGATEAVRHEKEALVVGPRDARALAAAIRNLLDDPSKRATLAENARRRVTERFAIEGMTRRIVELVYDPGATVSA